MNKINTGIYIRVSTEEQALNGFSIRAQEEKLVNYAVNIKDWNVYKVYKDEGISGKRIDNRESLKEMLDDIKNNRINNVLVFKIDRLTRSTRDLIDLVEYFNRYECDFNSLCESIDTSSATGRMFIKIIGIFAEFERENLAERVSMGYEQKTREGNYTNCNGVYGYDYVDGKLIVNDNESIVVKNIFNSFLNGESMLRIAKRLESNFVPTKRGGKWRSSTIKSILTNPLYIGNVRYGLHKNNGFEVVGKNIDKIISKELFLLVQDKFTYK